MARVATLADLSAFQKLWCEVFGDTPAFAELIFQKFAGADNVFVEEADGKVVSMISAVPCTLKERRGAYFYGLATAPEYRGRGHAASLMNFAERTLLLRGLSFAVLIPAEESLFSLYEKRGYQKAFTLRRLTRPIKRNLWAQADFDSCTANQLLTLRKKFCPDSILLTPQGMIQVLTDLYQNGVTVVSSQVGYALYFQREDTLEVIEIFAEGERAAEQLLEAAREKIGAEKAVITVGAGSTLFLGEGKRQDYGVIKFFAEPMDMYECYMRLMLDN